MKLKTVTAFAVIATKGIFPVDICNIEAKTTALRGGPLKPWAIFGNEKDAKRASVLGTPKHFKTKVVPITLTYPV